MSQRLENTTYQKPPIMQKAQKLQMRTDGFQPSAAAYVSETTQKFENLGKGADNDLKVEKALIEFNEIQNNIVISKGIDRPASALLPPTAADKRPAVTATSFNMATRNENWQQLNTTAGGFFKEGSILGTMDQMTKE